MLQSNMVRGAVSPRTSITPESGSELDPGLGLSFYWTQNCPGMGCGLTWTCSRFQASPQKWKFHNFYFRLHSYCCAILSMNSHTQKTKLQCGAWGQTVWNRLLKWPFKTNALERLYKKHSYDMLHCHMAGLEIDSDTFRWKMNLWVACPLAGGAFLYHCLFDIMGIRFMVSFICFCWWVLTQKVPLYPSNILRRQRYGTS